MKITKLDHVNIRTAQLENMISWYTDILGMTMGDRPYFPDPGAWMYVGDSAMVHLVSVDQSPQAGSEMSLKLEHFAFSATGGEEFIQRLRLKDIPYRRVDLPEIRIFLINLWDPDGNHIHVDFPLEEQSE